MYCNIQIIPSIILLMSEADSLRVTYLKEVKKSWQKFKTEKMVKTLRGLHVPVLLSFPYMLSFLDSSISRVFDWSKIFRRSAYFLYTYVALGIMHWKPWKNNKGFRTISVVFFFHIWKNDVLKLWIWQFLSALSATPSHDA